MPSTRPSVPVAGASAAPTTRPTLLPAATKYLRVAMSAAPSRSAPPASFTPTTYIPVLSSTIRIAGANQSTATDPATLQRTQANLACAIGVPQQNIQIRNMTMVYSNGTRTLLPFDPTVPQLNSGNEVVCLTVPPQQNTTRIAARLLQVTYTIEISYDIVDPPLVVLSMDGATFTASLTNTTAMTDLVLALQGTGLTVDAPPEFFMGLAAAPSPSPSSQSVVIVTTSSGISQGPLLYGVIGAIVGAIVVLGVVVGFVVIRLQTQRPAPVVKPSTPATEPARVVYVVENPMGAQTAMDDSSRNYFNPTGVRRV